MIMNQVITHNLLTYHWMSINIRKSKSKAITKIFHLHNVISELVLSVVFAKESPFWLLVPNVNFCQNIMKYFVCMQNSIYINIILIVPVYICTCLVFLGSGAAMTYFVAKNKGELWYYLSIILTAF